MHLHCIPVCFKDSGRVLFDVNFLSCHKAYSRFKHEHVSKVKLCNEAHSSASLLSMAKATPRVREWPLQGAEYALNWHRESPLRPGPTQTRAEIGLRI